MYCLSSEKLGTCIIGEHLIGEGRKIFSFNNPNPILAVNIDSFKIKRFRGRKASCYINRAVRGSKVQRETQNKYTEKIKIYIEKKFEIKTDIFDKLGDCIEGNQLISECESGEKDKKIQKISGYSASHSADRYNFSGDYCISYVDMEFTLSKAIKLK